tara:strand:- start:3700 stop:4656 length:957 start_codon:yes stop_codon:yes gene_type:complete
MKPKMVTAKKKQQLKMNQKTKKKKVKKVKKGFKTYRKYNKKDICSPSLKRGKNQGCFSKENLKKLKLSYNRSTKKKIESEISSDIYKELKKKFKKTCNKSEMCWLQNLGFTNYEKHKIKKESFAPYAPSSWKENPLEWLSNFDIDKIMEQYESIYPEFKYLGSSPIDFDKKIKGECVFDALCKLNLLELDKNKKFKIGVVFNLDPHDKPGSHWTAMFINLNKREICYFDSAGDSAPPTVKKLVKRIQNQALKQGINLNFIENHPVEHQLKDTECGIYVIYFLIHMLKGLSFNRFLNPNNVIRDKAISKYRKKYFNLPN